MNGSSAAAYCDGIDNNHSLVAAVWQISMAVNVARVLYCFLLGIGNNYGPVLLVVANRWQVLVGVLCAHLKEGAHVLPLRFGVPHASSLVLDSDPWYFDNALLACRLYRLCLARKK